MPVLILADAEGGQEVQVEGPVAIGRHQLRRRRAQTKALPHHMGRHPETRPYLLRAVALLVRQLAEGLELVGGVHGLAGDVLVEADLMGIVQDVHDHLDRMGLLDRLALHQHPQGLTTPLPDGDEIIPRRRALPVPLDLDHRRLKHALDPDRGRQRLDSRRRMPDLPGIPRGRLEPVQRDFDLRAMRGLRNRPGFGIGRGGLNIMSSHVCLLWARVAGTRKARLKPCPSARPG
ncbi:hypothetical protein D3C71_1461440 [compost metagenome]